MAHQITSLKQFSQMMMGEHGLGKIKPQIDLKCIQKVATEF